MKLTFHGGAGTVTGANYLFESGDTKILVDCGMLQGCNYCEGKNFHTFPYDPKDITAVFVSHAHIDHTGRIPQLIKEGFTGTIYSTPPTAAFAEELLFDSESIMRKEAEKHGQPPAYGHKEIEQAMNQWRGIPYHEPVQVGPFSVTLQNAGHILGSASIIIKAEGKTVVCSGDLGNCPAPIIPEHEPMPPADYCLIESTYGDRVHESSDTRREEVQKAIIDTVEAGGVLMIPAFAMERTQNLLYVLHTLFEEKRIPRVPVFMDSPLAIKLTRVYRKFTGYFDSESLQDLKEHGDILDFPGLRFTLHKEESKSINDVQPPKIIIAGSGMSNGGRILHHELRYLPDPKSTLLIVGYQAVGSLGRQLLDGAKEVRIFGQKIPVRARVVSITSYSAHADQPQLLEWLRPGTDKLKGVFVVQGEDGSEPLAKKIKEEFSVNARVPEAGETVVL